MSGTAINDAPDGVTAELTDVVPGVRGTNKIKLSISYVITKAAAELNGTLNPASHTHAIADVTNLQTALDGKAAVAHAHTEADITGTIAPSKLAQAGASSGQVLKWNGTAWVPADDNVGTGGGSTDWSVLTGIPAAIDAIDGLTPAADRLAYYTGANTAALAVITGFARTLLDDADAATARATLGITDGPSLAANQFSARNSADTAFEARTDKVVGSIFLPVTGNVAAGAAEGQIGMWGNKPCTLTAVRARTLGGTCSIQIRKNGTAINGFATAVAQTTTVTNTASTEALAQDNVLDVVVTSASSLTGLFITLLGVRTAD